MRFPFIPSLRRGAVRRSSFLLLGILTAALATAFVAVAQEAREWRNAKGKTILTQDRQKLVGKLLVTENDDPKKIRVEMDGRTFNFPLAQLSAADQKYVKSERAKKKETQKTNSGDSKPTDSKPTTKPTDSKPAPAKEGVKRALLIGVNDYQEFADVKYAVADVEAIRAQLLNLEFQSKNIVVLKSQGDAKTRPTQVNLRRQIAAFLESAQENDFLFIYFSGHAFQTRGAARFAPENAIATHDAGVVDSERTISLTELIDDLDSSKAMFKWLVVDACRQNPTGESNDAAKAKALKILEAPRGVLVLQSCSEGEFSADDDAAKRGLFAGRFLEALTGKADVDADGKISAREICQYVSEETNKKSQARFNTPQTPCFNEDGEDFFVAKIVKKSNATQKK